MSQPPDPYQRQYDFTDHSIQLPNAPQPGNKIDLELNEVRESLNHTISRLSEIQRDDGKLRDCVSETPGPVGPIGPQGVPGVAGINGINGQQGVAGVAGVQGVQGIQGIQGIQGPQGDKYACISTTTLQLSNGTKTFTTQTGLAWTSQQDLTIVYDAGHHMHGTVTTYNAQTGTMVVDISQHTGTGGPFSQWTINIEGAIGTQGPVGPAGPQGEQGIQGIQGQAGAVGPAGPGLVDGLTISAAAATYKTIVSADLADAGKAPLSHTHTIANVTGLQTALDGKSGTAHTHSYTQITGLTGQIETLNQSIALKLGKVLDVSTSMIYTAGALSIPAGSDLVGDRAMYNVQNRVIGARSWMVQRPEFLGKWIFLNVDNADHKRQTKGPLSYVEFTQGDGVILARGDLEFEDAGLVIGSSCTYVTLVDAAGSPWSGYYQSSTQTANGSGGYTNVNVEGQSPCHYPAGYVLELGGQSDLSFNWSDSEGHTGNFVYGYQTFSSKTADGIGGYTYTNQSTFTTASAGYLIHSDAGQCSGSLDITFDGVSSYNTSDTRVSDPGYGTYLRSDSGTLDVTLCGSNYQVGSWSGDIYSNGSCGEYFEGTTEYVPYGTYLTNCDGYNYYSNGSGGYYSEGTGGCDPDGTHLGTTSGDLYVYIDDDVEAINVIAGSYTADVYADGNCSSYDSNQSNSWYAYGVQIHSNASFNYFSDGAGSYYAEAIDPNPCEDPNLHIGESGWSYDGCYWSYSDPNNCSGNTGMTSSNNVIIYIYELSNSYSVGTEYTYEYYNSDCSTSWGTSGTEYLPYGTYIAGPDGNGNNYYSNGSGGYYAEFAPI